MGFFDGTKDMAAAGQYPRLRPGIYPEITVRRTHVVQGHNGVRFVLEGEVTAPPRPSGEVDKLGQPVPPTPLGAIGSWTADIGGQYAHLYGKPEVKACVGAVLGYDLDETNRRGQEVENVSNACVEKGRETILAGRKVATSCETKPTKTSAIVKHQWFPVAGQPAFALDQAAPVVLAPPAAVAAPAAPVATPLARALAAGWTQHPASPPHVYKGTEVTTPETLCAEGRA